jgi:saccharopine dehydrogenase-like NADP-dependent oxidoreductase
MRKIVIIGAGFAGTMISYCIAQTNQKCSLVIVSESKELETHIEKNNFPKEIMILTA